MAVCSVILLSETDSSFIEQQINQSGSEMQEQLLHPTSHALCYSDHGCTSALTTTSYTDEMHPKQYITAQTLTRKLKKYNNLSQVSHTHLHAVELNLCT
jgi:phosphopentomutase